LIYNKLTEFFADFRHICRAVILLIFSYLHYINSIDAARRRHDGGGGLEIIVNKYLRNNAARAAVHVVNIKPSTFNYHLFLCGGSAVGKRHHHRRRPPSRRAVFRGIHPYRKGLVLGAKKPVLAALESPMVH